MEKLNFSYNWNGKLNCTFFTTLRRANPEKYRVGSRFAVEFKNSQLGIVEVVDCKNVTLNSLNDWVLALDTGYTGNAGKDIFRKMYKLKDNEDLLLSFVLFKYV